MHNITQRVTLVPWAFRISQWDAWKVAHGVLDSNWTPNIPLLEKKRKENLTSINPTWIWARWPYRAQESPWCMTGFTTYLMVGGPLYVGVMLPSILLLCEGKEGSMGLCLLLSSLLLSTRYVRYLIAIRWMFFMVLFIHAIGICSSLSCVYCAS